MGSHVFELGDFKQLRPGLGNSKDQFCGIRQPFRVGEPVFGFLFSNLELDLENETFFPP